MKDKPSTNSPVTQATPENLKLLSEVFQRIENETAEVADLLFEYLIDVPDEQIMTGTIPLDHPNRRIAAYIKILNRLFLFSRKQKRGGFRIVNRKMIQELDKKTYTICICFDGGVSLDILCDVVNTENQARTPTTSPVKVTVKQVFIGDLERAGASRGFTGS
ncbi:MAG: hypothetical protein FJX34_01125 [Alphaproteobacteria bacterium]|nr:hypothetical protein [Alphaproteobacteria bacterium]